MRLYLHPALSKFFSIASLFLALGVAFFITTKAISVWSTDPNLQQIPKILNQQEQ
ncbi:MAG TPA: hypothetical protein V6D29_04880 [Leptolyngbyaceae cyanobacterium]